MFITVLPGGWEGSVGGECGRKVEGGAEGKEHLYSILMPMLQRDFMCLPLKIMPSDVH